MLLEDIHDLREGNPIEAVRWMKVSGLAEMFRNVTGRMIVRAGCQVVVSRRTAAPRAGRLRGLAASPVSRSTPAAGRVTGSSVWLNAKSQDVPSLPWRRLTAAPRGMSARTGWTPASAVAPRSSQSSALSVSQVDTYQATPP